MRKILVVTSTRAEYGILKNTLNGINGDSDLELQLIVTGSHLSEDFGYTINEILEDGFKIDEKIPILINGNHKGSNAKEMGLLMIGLSQTFERLNPDLLIVIGDRYEMLAVASTAIVMNIPIVHIAGGEITEGAFDNQIRHSITKLSHIHLTSCEAFSNNVINMGEEKWRVKNVGALGIENIKSIKFLTSQQLKEYVGFEVDKKTLLVTFHPTTLESIGIKSQINNFIDALKFINMKCIITYPNSDLGSNYIIKRINEYAKGNNKVFITKNLGIQKYLSVMKLCGAVVGNSSSGIIEAPYLKVPVVNIGNRQKGRIFASNIIQCNYDTQKIIQAIQLALSIDFSEKSRNTISLYGNGNCSYKIIEILKNIEINEKLLKKKLIWR